MGEDKLFKGTAAVRKPAARKKRIDFILRTGYRTVFTE
jgi:hypothetical protein